MTVDEIIARRAPEREAMKATMEAEALLAEDDDELEAEMMAELQGSEEEEFKGIGSDAQDDEGSDDEEEEEEEDVELEKKEEEGNGEVVVDDEENWLGLGRVSDDEKEEDDDAQQDEKSSDEEEESEVEEDESEVKGEIDSDFFRYQELKKAHYLSRSIAASSAFAALADMEDDMSDSDDEATPSKQPETIPTESALSKSFFTSHRNASASTAKSLSFNTLPNATLSRQLLLALGSLNLSTPTPIQSECIPLAMMGKDIVASSATGSGKTVAFWVGVLERLLHRDRKNPCTRVVVMTPTRELAVQVHGVGKALARYTDVQFCLCVGEFSLFPLSL